MTQSDFVNDIRQRTDHLWNAIFEHPFVRGLGDGTLPRDSYEFYLKQDYVYLIDFSRVLAIASAKAQHLPDMSRFAEFLNMTLNVEMDLHRRTCAEYGINKDELERTEPSLINLAYTNYLVRACYEGSFADILAGFMPCAAGYVEIAGKLRQRGLPDNKNYRAWIETYTSPEMKEAIDWLTGRMNAFARESSKEDRGRWFRLYRDSARFELLFFDMGWQKSMWPALVVM